MEFVLSLRHHLASRHHDTQMRTFALVLLAVLAMTSDPFAARASAAALQVEFVDSSTGYSVQPEGVEARPHLIGAHEQRMGRAQVGADGRAVMQLERGRHTITANHSAYQPIAGEVEVRENFPYRIRFLLDPLEKPRELQIDNIVARHRDNATLFQGF